MPQASRSGAPSDLPSQGFVGREGGSASGIRPDGAKGSPDVRTRLARRGAAGRLSPTPVRGPPGSRRRHAPRHSQAGPDLEPVSERGAHPATLTGTNRKTVGRTAPSRVAPGLPSALGWHRLGWNWAPEAVET